MNCIAKNSKEITIMNNMKKIITRITTFFVLCMMVASQSAYAIESVTFFHHDALGSTIAATDESGNLLWTEEYKPYGGRLKRDSASTENNTWYTGKQEGAYGLTYFHARWYDNEAGRFMAIDPVGFDEGNIQSFNRYAYANNNPYKYTDPDGKFAVQELLIVGAIITLLTLLLTQQVANNSDLNGGYNSTSGDDESSNAGDNSLIGAGASSGALPPPDEDPNKKPKLKQIHSKKTLKNGSNKYSYDYWNTRSTDSIVKSLKPGKNNPEGLIIKPDGRIIQGNTRTTILQDRGFDINKLPRIVE